MIINPNKQEKTDIHHSNFTFIVASKKNTNKKEYIIPMDNV